MDGEQHTHEETQSDEHVNEDGSRVETEKTEKVEVETGEDSEPSPNQVGYPLQQW